MCGYLGVSTLGKSRAGYNDGFIQVMIPAQMGLFSLWLGLSLSSITVLIMIMMMSSREKNTLIDFEFDSSSGWGIFRSLNGQKDTLFQPIPPYYWTQYTPSSDCDGVGRTG